jgi:hypothetical protein
MTSQNLAPIWTTTNANRHNVVSEPNDIGVGRVVDLLIGSRKGLSASRWCRHVGLTNLVTALTSLNVNNLAH